MNNEILYSVIIIILVIIILVLLHFNIACEKKLETLQKK